MNSPAGNAWHMINTNPGRSYSLLDGETNVLLMLGSLYKHMRHLG